MSTPVHILGPFRLTRCCASGNCPECVKAAIRKKAGPGGKAASWRCVVVTAAGEGIACDGGTQDEARALAEAECVAELDGRPPETVSAAAALFVAHKGRLQAWAPGSFTRARQDLAQFTARPDVLLAELSGDLAQAYLARMAEQGLALSSQRSRWAQCVEACEWWRCRRWLSCNPCRDVHGSDLPWRGKRARRLSRRGKPQLRNAAEARAYLATAARLDTAQHRAAALLPLLAMMRSGEVRHLRCGDVDWELGVLWIRAADLDDDDGDGWDVKSASSTRQIRIPRPLAADLAELCKGRNPGALVFRSRGNGPFEVSWLQRLVARVCAAAGTKVVCPHGLRGTGMSILACLGQVAPPDVARLVGHSDAGETARKHYLGGPQVESDLDLH